MGRWIALCARSSLFFSSALDVGGCQLLLSKQKRPKTQLLLLLPTCRERAGQSGSLMAGPPIRPSRSFRERSNNGYVSVYLSDTTREVTGTNCIAQHLCTLAITLPTPTQHVSSAKPFPGEQHVVAFAHSLASTQSRSRGRGRFIQKCALLIPTGMSVPHPRVCHQEQANTHDRL